MADSNISIEIQLKTRGIRSIEELEDAIRDVRKAFKEAELGTEAYENAAKTLPQLLDMKAKAMDRVASSNARMMKSYFQTGQEIRANALPAVQEFGRVIQDAPFGIQGVANNITQLVSTFTTLRNQTGSTSSALKAMIGTLTGPAGFLLAVSAVTSLAVAFGDKLFPAVEKTGEKLSDVLDKMLELGRISPEQRMDVLIKRQEALRKRMIEVEESYGRGQIAIAASGSSLAGIPFASFSDVLEAQDKFYENELKIKKLYEKTELHKSLTTPTFTGITLPTFGAPTVGGIDKKDMEFKPPEDARGMVDQWGLEAAIAESTQEGIEKGAAKGGSAIGNVLSNTIMNIVEGSSAESIFKGLLSFGLNLATAGIGGSVAGLLGFHSGGTISEPVFGVGRSGRMYTFAERGPEYVMPTHQMTRASGGYGGGGPVQVTGEFRMRGSDLVATVERRQRMNSARLS